MSKRLVSAASLLAALLLISGCLVESKIDATGGGTMHIRYRAPRNAKLEALKADLQSADVTVEKGEIDKQGYADFQLKFADVTKLPSARFFKNTKVTHEDGPEKGTKTLTATVRNAKTGTAPDKVLEFYGNDLTVELTLPGEVVKTNAASHKGDTATWKIPLNDYLSAKETTFSATYKAGAAAAGAASGAAAATPEGKGSKATE